MIQVTNILVNWLKIINANLFRKSRFVEEVLSQPKSEVVAFPKIEMKWDWVSDVHVYIKSDAVIWFWHYRHVRTRQTSAQRCGANKLATKLELVLLLNEFSHGIFQRFVFMLSTRFVRTSGNNFNCLTKHGATLFSLHLETFLLLGLWWICLRYDIFFLMLETEESIFEIGSHHIFARSVGAVIV